MPEVFLWGDLRPAANGAASVTVDAKTIRELFRKLEEQYPLIAPALDGIAVSIDGVIYQDDWAQELPAGGEVYLLPRIAGG